MAPDRRSSALDERKAAILRAVVEEYIETAQPVGSSRVARASGVEVSAATVRNEMVTLELEGYLEQPHTSAGRIPTDKGYRFFVDSLEGPAPLDRIKRQQVSEFFARAHGELERMLEDTGRLLSSLTDYAAVVVGHPLGGATVRSVQLVGLSDRFALLVVVLSNGTIEKHAIELDDDADEVRLGAATTRLSGTLVGRSLGAVADVSPTGDEVTDRLVVQAMDAIRAIEGPEADAVFVGGASRMAGSFGAIETVKEVLTILEEQLVVVSLVRDVIDRGLSVAIGSETGIQLLSECAVVVAPYEVEGETAGTIGVLGPTRMHYPEAMAAVAMVGKRLGAALSEG